MLARRPLQRSLLPAGSCNELTCRCQCALGSVKVGRRARAIYPPTPSVGMTQQRGDGVAGWGCVLLIISRRGVGRSLVSSVKASAERGRRLRRTRHAGMLTRRLSLPRLRYVAPSLHATLSSFSKFAQCVHACMHTLLCYVKVVV